MLSILFRHLTTWLKPIAVVGDSGSNTGSITADSASIFELDPNWHGDHWQNLLSSPMDARRYVMEDWSVPVAPDWTAADGVAIAR